MPTVKTLAQLRAMAAKGGEATKRKMASDPGYYSRIAKLRRAGFGHPPKRRPAPARVVDALQSTIDEIYG